jgi:uncharacterized protein YcbK (DUF882 family)
MATINYKKGSKTKLSAHFNSSEFDCNCTSCDTTLIDSELIDMLEDLRSEVNAPLKIHSGYRCEAHNKAIGGAQNSTHTSGRAADISIKDLDRLYDEACQHFYAVGDGRNKGFIHVDTRSDKTRRWNY